MCEDLHVKLATLILVDACSVASLLELSCRQRLFVMRAKVTCLLGAADPSSQHRSHTAAAALLTPHPRGCKLLMLSSSI